MSDMVAVAARMVDLQARAEAAEDALERIRGALEAARDAVQIIEVTAIRHVAAAREAGYRAGMAAGLKAADRSMVAQIREVAAHATPIALVRRR